MSSRPDVAIIGAGPYGLSLAAHLRRRGVTFRIFGSPMSFWRTRMPKGMQLKSDGFASNLYDPDGTFPLSRYCSEAGVSYSDTAVPVSLETFAAYGMEFQRRFVPDLEPNMVVELAKSPGGFELGLENEERVHARKVVVASGIASFEYIPPEISHLPAALLSHSSAHRDLTVFAGRSVAVIGAGSSATDLAALLNEAGAEVQLVSRHPPRFHFGLDDGQRTLWRQLCYPRTGIGFGWRARFFCDVPWLFHLLPQRLRLRVVRKTLGPVGGWFMRDRVVGRVPILSGYSPAGAEVRQGKAHLELRGADGSHRIIVADHVIAATGYRVDLRRLAFLGPGLRSDLKAVDHTPILSATMQASVPGLYFAGTTTANSFGPLMRFAFGARYTSGLLTEALARR